MTSMLNVGKTQPLVSVILPVYNGGRFISSCLTSVLSQSWRHLEVIVVDDGSTDNTSSIVNTFAELDSRVRLLQQPNGGVAKARNRAIGEATGEFIAPIDADDLWAPDKIKKQVMRMTETGDQTGLVYSWWVWLDESASIIDRSPLWRLEGDVFTKLLEINFVGSASVPLFRRTCVQEVGGYDETLLTRHAQGCEDWDLAIRIAERHRVAVVAEVLLGYRRLPGSMSSATDTMWRSHLLVTERLKRVRPDLKPGLFRTSSAHFAMYLAGLSFWSGNIPGAIRWASRGGFRLILLTSPYLLKLLVARVGKKTREVKMMPGIALEEDCLPKPLVPYDRVRLLPALGYWLGTFLRVFRRIAELLLHEGLIARMRFERQCSLRSKVPRQVRVFTMACWHFPIYSQTFVYRELLTLIEKNVNVRIVYCQPSGRNRLPTECLPLWRNKRRLVLTEANGVRDLEYYQRRMPAKVREIKQQVSEASGLSWQELSTHLHFRCAFSFARYVEAWQPDYLHTYFFYEASLFGLVASSLLGLPYGISCYSDHMLDDYSLKMVPLHMDLCDVVVATSARIRQELVLLSGKDIPAAIVKPNGIDTTLFSARALSKPSHNHPFRVVVVSRIHPKKGLLYLVDTARLLRDKGHSFSIEIIGDADTHDVVSEAYLGRLKHEIQVSGVEDLILLRGRRSSVQIKEHLATADVFVAPFIELDNGDKDGIPTALLEAMAAGCPIVTTDAGSIPEVIQHGEQGLVVPQRNSMALADAISRIVSDETLCRHLSSAALARVRENYDVSHCEALFHGRIEQAVGTTIGGYLPLTQ